MTTLFDKGYNWKMAETESPGEYRFEVLTVLGFEVRVTQAYWDLIVSIKHPVMVDRENDVKGVLENPSEIRRSKSDPEVYLFYKPEGMRRWICAVAKRLNGEGFLITTYLTDAVKEGEVIWPK